MLFQNSTQLGLKFGYLNSVRSAKCKCRKQSFNFYFSFYISHFTFYSSYSQKVAAIHVSTFGWGFIICKSYVTPAFFILCTFRMYYVLSPWHYLHNMCSKWSCSKRFRLIPVDMQPIPIVSMTFTWRFWKGINSPRD